MGVPVVLTEPIHATGFTAPELFPREWGSGYFLNRAAPRII